VKTVELGEAHLESCVADAQDEQVVLTRRGKAVALLIGLDEEQEQLGQSERFWDLIAERRRQPTISRQELEKGLDGALSGARD
jgi:antitoxin (DNA-binding transcriptional repressor) of toxin-antitoxin stability system